MTPWRRKGCWRFRCLLKWNACTLKHFDEQLWAVCIRCERKQVFMNEWKFITFPEPR